MERVLLKITTQSHLLSNCFNVEGILDRKSNILKYQEPDNTHVIINLFNHSLIRENDKILMTFKFSLDSVTENEYLLKDMKKVLKIDIFTHKVDIRKNFYSVEYSINNDRFIYTVEFV